MKHFWHWAGGILLVLGAFSTFVMYCCVKAGARADEAMGLIFVEEYHEGGHTDKENGEE